MCRHKCMDLCIYMCMDMCIDMYIEMCIDMCIDMSPDMCIDMCMHMWHRSPRPTWPVGIAMCSGQYSSDMCCVDARLDIGVLDISFGCHRYLTR